MQYVWLIWSVFFLLIWTVLYVNHEMMKSDSTKTMKKSDHDSHHKK
ncbi:MAG: hypothetical protein KJ799_01580 [Bacteroidetes bacterium]|nr:hypothetical protein [Bacteroidota bacterium]MBU2505403.1 hypothetical protein [Bacteroidota bacterium]